MLCLKQQMSEEPTEEDLQEEEFIESSSNNTLNRNMWKTDLLEVQIDRERVKTHLFTNDSESILT